MTIAESSWLFPKSAHLPGQRDGMDGSGKWPQTWNIASAPATGYCMSHTEPLPFSIPLRRRDELMMLFIPRFSDAVACKSVFTGEDLLDGGDGMK